MKHSEKAIIVIPLIVMILVSCGNRSGTSPVKPVLTTDTCATNLNNTYAIYIPEHTAGCEKMPLVVIIDPHGSGNFAVERFISAANSYKFILGASNLVKNNFPDYIRAIEQLIQDIRNKHQVTDEIYLAGFSGGARMALSYAHSHTVDGVLACGALASGEQLSSLNTTVFAISGMADFNFPEMAQFILDEKKKPSNLRIHLDGDLHEWPSSKDISYALGWFYLKKNRTAAKCIKLKSMMDTYVQLVKKLTDSLSLARQYLQVKMICQNLVDIENIPDRKYFEDLLSRTENNPGLRDELAHLGKSLQFEYRVREAYYNAIYSHDTIWWKKEINDLNEKSNDSSDLMMQYAYKRIRAFLGIMCYSLANNTIRSGDLKTAEKILKLYRLTEPENPDMFYFYALYELKKGNSGMATRYLKDAFDKGYTDKIQIDKDFPVSVRKAVRID